MEFIFPEVALYLYKSITRTRTEYRCHALTDVPSCYLEMWDNYKNGYVRLLILHSLEPLGHCENVATLSIFYRYYFVRCSSELAQLVPLPYSRGRSTGYSDRLHNFPFTISKCCKDVNVNSFFARSTRLLNSLLIEWFPLTYDLNGFKPRNKRHLLPVQTFLNSLCLQ